MQTHRIATLVPLAVGAAVVCTIVNRANTDREEWSHAAIQAEPGDWN